ncbi:MAG: zf-HC2 domain-containing protein [Caldimonas sp.]
MNGRVVPLGSETHRAMELLLPWYVNGALEPAEAAGFESHLRDCPNCQAELAWQRRLASLEAAPEAASAVDRGWTALKRELAARERPPAGRPRRARPPRAPRRAWGGWLPWAFAFQSVCLVILAALAFASGRNAPLYRGLAAAAPAPTANVLVVFRPETSEARIREILRAQDARLVGGPTATDAYLLQVPARRVEAALVRWHADPAIAHAESLDATPPTR